MIQAAEDLAATSGDSVYRLTMEFKGWLNGSLVGFYKTTYMEDGQIRSIAATDHEPTDARKFGMMGRGLLEMGSFEPLCQCSLWVGA